MRIVITGSDGQVGRALQASAPAHAIVVALNRQLLDITDADAVATLLARRNVDLLINAAAFTAVDRAEAEPDPAQAVNATAVGSLAAASAACGVRFVQLSTDFVFDGRSCRAYRPDDPTAPLGVYGRSKRDGELLARHSHPHCLILRTAWVYAPEGRNFVATMLRLMRAGKPLRVVCDQIGTPTYAPHLAAALWTLIARDAEGLLHFTDSGVATWYDFAVAIQDEALAAGVLAAPVEIEPIATSDYPTPARRPAFSVLDKSDATSLLGRAPPHWRVGLRAMIRGMNRHG